MINKPINYINKSFGDFRNKLIDFSKIYFPNTFNDFSPSSPAMIFIEMASYVGDILSFYQDNQIQETFLQYSKKLDNLYDMSYLFGYRPKVTGVSTVNVDIYQQLPAINNGNEIVPDFTYSLNINENLILKSNIDPSVNFIVQDSIDFSISSSFDPTNISIYQVAGDEPTFFLLKKTRKAISANIKTINFSVDSPQEFLTFNINDENIIGILDIIDSDGNKWHEVDYLAQEIIYEKIKNKNIDDSYYTLRTIKTPNRFVSRHISENNFQIQFGSGNSSDITEEIIPNTNNIGINLPYGRTNLTTAFDPSNFMFNNTYGISPSNTTLTVRYLVGGGINSNINSNTINTFEGNILFQINNLDNIIADYVFNSISVNNPEASDGGGDGDSIEQLRQNIISNFPTQLRNITIDDYLIRTLSMPPEYGNVAKAFIEQTKISNSINQNSILDLYILGYDNNKNLRYTSNILKNNLKTYLYQYRSIGDNILIKDAYIINIGVNFDIIVLPNFNNNEVLRRCIIELQNYFDIDKWKINQPIILKEIDIALNKIEGVQTVKNIEIINKTGSNYSIYSYDIKGATFNNTIYPSLDPSIFELKFPNIDIKGKISSF